MSNPNPKASSIDEAFLLKKNHLFHKADFTRLFSLAQKKHGRLFVMYYQQEMQSLEPMLGLVVSKKYARTSIQRNLVKRLVREHFRLSQHALQNLHIMFVAKKGIDVASKEALHQDLEQLLAFLKKLQIPVKTATLS